MCEHEHHHHCKHTHNTMLRIVFAVILLFFAILSQNTYIKLAIYFCAYMAVGYDILLTALNNIRKGEVFDENFLMSIATIGAFAIKEYPEAVMVMVLYQIGEHLQEKAVKKSKKSITGLMNIRQDYANLEQDKTITKISPKKVKLNDIIIVKPGEKIPLDGIVIKGASVIDTSAITGESIPQNITCGDTAISGCLNINSVIKIKVTKEYHDSTVAKIIELVEHAASKKTKTEKFITKFAKIYTPAVVIGAVLLAIIPPFITDTGFNIWFQRALTFLVISCPCALVISVPLAFFAGIGKASANGILIKGSKYIELLANTDTIAFDKTGTLTRGMFTVKKILPQHGISQDELLKTAAIAEEYSNHPIANSIKSAAAIDIDKNIITDMEEFPGQGLKVQAGGNKILCGNIELMKNFNIPVKEQNEYGTVMYIAQNGSYLGSIIISDELKPNSIEAIKTIEKLKIKTAMLTGDRTAAAEIIGQELGIRKIYSELLPADKVTKIEELTREKSANKNIVFVGDGINDAPVLTAADIGIAMGGLGSDAAIEASDVVIMDDNLLKIPAAIKLAGYTMSIAKQNIILALGIKILFLMLGAFGLINLWSAVFADVGVTVIAVCNSLRLLTRSFAETPSKIR